MPGSAHRSLEWPAIERLAERRTKRPVRRLQDHGPHLPVGPPGKLLAHIIHNRLGGAIGVGRQLVRRLGRERDAEGGIAQRLHDARTPVGRRFFDQSGEVGDALRRSVPADRAHRLLARAGIDPGADQVRDDEPEQQDQERLAEQALGQKAGHSRLTSGVKI